MTKLIFAASLLLAPLAKAETPHVVTSVAPLQGMVADIMKGVGTPELLLNEPISTHDFAMRPSQAKAISDADILFYVGQHLEPWLEKALQSRSDSGLVIALGDAPNLTLLEARELDQFGERHDDHDDHDEHDSHDEHEHEGAYDPHLWLDPENALIWLDIITSTLEVADPENKDTYRNNHDNSRDAIVAAMENAQQSLEPLANTNLIVTHDSIQYFEHAFGLTVTGAFSASDGHVAGARSLNTLLGGLDAETCIVEDLTHPSGITANLPDDVKLITLDPMGYDLLDEEYFPRLLNTLAQTLLECRT